jgi:uncharacterized protein YndB with AHSA1/START domain
MECKIEIRIASAVERVFALLAAVERYDDWLPPSDAFIRVELVRDGPIQIGTAFVDYQTHGIEMPGEVHIYEPPRRIGFRQRMKLPLGAEISTRMEYTLEADGDGTRVVRHQVFTIPWLLRPIELIAKGKMIKEVRRILDALKRAAESASHRTSASE